MLLDGRTKGMPHLAEPFELGSIGTLGLSLEDLPLPVMVLRSSALEHNLGMMQAFCREHGVDVRSARQDHDGSPAVGPPARSGRLGPHRRDRRAGACDA